MVEEVQAESGEIGGIWTRGTFACELHAQQNDKRVVANLSHQSGF